jgi:hypothetical protein
MYLSTRPPTAEALRLQREQKRADRLASGHCPDCSFTFTTCAICADTSGTLTGGYGCTPDECKAPR